MFEFWNIDSNGELAAVTPAMVEKSIVVALEKAWKPEESDAPFILDLNL